MSIRCVDAEFLCCAHEEEFAYSEPESDEEERWDLYMLVRLRHEGVRLREEAKKARMSTHRIAHAKFEEYRNGVARALREARLPQMDESLLVVRHPKEKEHAGLEKRDSHGLTCLHKAVLKGCEPEIAALCVAGAQVDAVDHMCITPFLLAVKTGAAGAAKLLLSFGCGLDRKNAQSFHPLILAAEHGQTSTFRIVAKALRARGKLRSVAGFKGNGYTALHFAAVNNKPDLLACALRFDEFRAVVDVKSDGSTTGTALSRELEDNLVHYQTALHKAVLYRHKHCVAVLLRYGANPNVAGGDAGSAYPLASAVVEGDHDCTKLLLDYGADPVVAHAYLEEGEEERHDDDDDDGGGGDSGKSRRQRDRRRRRRDAAATHLADHPDRSACLDLVKDAKATYSSSSSASSGSLLLDKKTARQPLLSSQKKQQTSLRDTFICFLCAS
ncbi:hypothetical protein CTAYLR_009797 [Chrysophaeum taylorii]|uniref:Uncharacterized protein n=1 Tax=Chrysophaeum taylorii TaxID=2483200 RepID=A0AAD7UMD8_9STRA|nr:hypothetical protein CTAYLR_009797 [Chrysophaeum taylorii]